MEIETSINDMIDAAVSGVFPTGEAELGAKEEPTTGQVPPNDVQEEVEATPESVEAADLAKAWQEIGRAKGKYGTEPAGIAGKSEAEIVAFATELETLRREEDRTFKQQAQGESASEPSDEDAKGAGPEAQAAPVIPDNLNALLTSLKEEGREEEADQLLGVIQTQQSQLDALTARLDGDAQARQLAPLQKAVDEVFAGVEQQLPNLSNSQREDLMGLAGQIAKANPARFENMSPTEKVAASLSSALEVAHGVKAASPEPSATPKPRALAEAASHGSTRNVQSKPSSIDEMIEAAGNKTMQKYGGSLDR